VAQTWVAIFGAVIGLALLAGLLTPIAALVTGLGALGLGFSFVSTPAPNLFDSKVASVLTLIVAIAIVFLGPGAFSVDARLFGRREIIIPRRPEQ
jgi:uncharacterized membrane protein YphA (DoxX/SURF4 family)